MGEQLSDKQQVVGSSPTFCKTNNVSCIWDGGVHGWRAGLKNRERWFDSTPSHQRECMMLSWLAPGSRSNSRIGDYIIKTLSSRPASGDPHHWFPFCGTFVIVFFILCLLIKNIQRDVAAGSVSFSIYLEIYRNKNYYIAESFYIQARVSLFFTLLFLNILGKASEKLLDESFSETLSNFHIFMKER